MANYNMQKQADLTDHIESAVRSGVDIGKAGLRTAKDLWHKSILPAMHSGEKVLTDDFINPAISKLKSYAGPGWESLKGLYRKYGRPAYNKVVKGLTGVEDFGRRAARAATAVKDAAPGIKDDLGEAADTIVADLKRLYRSTKSNSRRTIDNIKRDLILHGVGNSANFGAFRGSVGPTISGTYDSIRDRLSSGMNKSSALRGLGFTKNAGGVVTSLIDWGKNIAKEESSLLAREAAERAARSAGQTVSGTMHSAASPLKFTWKATPEATAATSAQKATAEAAEHANAVVPPQAATHIPTPQNIGAGSINFNVYPGMPGYGYQAAGAAANQAETLSRETINSTVEDAIRRAMAEQGNTAASTAAAAVPKTFGEKFKDIAPSALLFGGLGYGAHSLLSGGDQPQLQPQNGYYQPEFFGAQMAQQSQNPLYGLIGRNSQNI